MKIVGLTGGIACGKSTVSTMLHDGHGLPIIDADEIAKAALDVGAPAYGKVVAAFGNDILEPSISENPSASDVATLHCPPNGSRPIDRKKLGEVVFNDVTQRHKLNRIISPYIARAMAWQCLKHFAIGTPVLVLDVPLLYETVAKYPRDLARLLLCIRLVPGSLSWQDLKQSSVCYHRAYTVYAAKS
eukprot:COSAG02_NODE_994_length_15358_cov_42.651812_5_plen_187_part_00